jgi:hypothetical protein
MMMMEVVITEVGKLLCINMNPNKKPKCLKITAI